MKKIIILIGILFFAFPVFVKADETEIYYKTIYDYTGNVVLNEQITVEEFENSSFGFYSTVFSTTYKSLKISVNNNIVTLDCVWKGIPTYQSFDVIALRTENVDFDTNNLMGYQKYVKDGTPGVVNYTKNSNNTKIFTNGTGVSMNLVNNATAYSLTLSIPYRNAKSNAVIYGSYQHATKDLDLDTSQKYSLSSKGYGNVVLFQSPVNNYYDAMNGVYISV